MLTKQHLEVIALALRRARPPDHFSQSGLPEDKRMELRAMDEQWVRTVEMFCVVLQQDNRNFSRDKFTDYIQTGRYQKK